MNNAKKFSKAMNNNKNKLNNEISVRLGLDKNENYFTIQLIFTTIHRPHCTFWHYSWILLYYFN